METQAQTKLNIINSAELMDMQLPPIKFTVADILPSGLTVFAGAPKVGKSLFILKLCLAVANGESFWCYPTRKDSRSLRLSSYRVAFANASLNPRGRDTAPFLFS